MLIIKVKRINSNIKIIVLAENEINKSKGFRICNAFQTPIEYDMKVHLRYTHRKELVTHLPLRGKGFDMNYRIAFVTDFLKRRRPQEFYDHETAEFVPPYCLVC